jgi:hypothetical protein
VQIWPAKGSAEEKNALRPSCRPPSLQPLLDFRRVAIQRSGKFDVSTARHILHRLCTQAAIHDESSEILSHRPHSPLNPPVPSSLHRNGIL